MYTQSANFISEKKPTKNQYVEAILALEKNSKKLVESDLVKIILGPRELFELKNL